MRSKLIKVRLWVGELGQRNFAQLALNHVVYSTHMPDIYRFNPRLMIMIRPTLHDTEIVHKPNVHPTRSDSNIICGGSNAFIYFLLSRATERTSSAAEETSGHVSNPLRGCHSLKPRAMCHGRNMRVLH